MNCAACRSWKSRKHSLGSSSRNYESGPARHARGHALAAITAWQAHEISEINFREKYGLELMAAVAFR